MQRQEPPGHRCPEPPGGLRAKINASCQRCRARRLWGPGLGRGICGGVCMCFCVSQCVHTVRWHAQDDHFAFTQDSRRVKFKLDRTCWMRNGTARGLDLYRLCRMFVQVYTVCFTRFHRSVVMGSELYSPPCANTNTPTH